MVLNNCCNAARWTARILGLSFFVIISFFVVAHAFSPEGLPSLWQASHDVQLDSLALMLMVVGGVVGWKWEYVASVMILAGYVLWQIVERHLPWPPGLIEIPVATGLLYAFAWLVAPQNFQPRKRAWR